MTFKQRISSLAFQLNDTDDSIIEYILTNEENISNISIQKMASDLFIASNAIMRLAKKLGYSGFSEMKFSLSKESLAQDSKYGIYFEMIEKIPYNIAKTVDIIDNSTLYIVVKKILTSTCCMFAGVGDSIYFCEMMAKNIKCLNMKAEYYIHLHEMFYFISKCKETDIIIIISASGKTDRICELALEAKKRKASVISITHLCENPLADIADVNLYFWGENRNVNGYNVTDRSGLMVLLRILSEKFWKAYCV